MKYFLVEIHIDHRPALSKVMKVSQPWTAAQLGLREAIKNKTSRHRPIKFNISLTKINHPNLQSDES